jgi:hypothetical protein
MKFFPALESLPVGLWLFPDCSDTFFGLAGAETPVSY